MKRLREKIENSRRMKEENVGAIGLVSRLPLAWNFLFRGTT